MSPNDDTADREGVDALVAHLENRFGDRFRACVVYDLGGVTLEYARDDISEAAIHSQTDRIADLYEAERVAREPRAADTEFGHLRASAHVFDEAVVVHLLRGDRSAVGVSMDPAIAGRLSNFVEDCKRVLAGRSPSTDGGGLRRGATSGGPSLNK